MTQNITPLWKTKPNFSKFNSVWPNLKYVNMCWHLAVLWITWIQSFRNNVKTTTKYTIFATIYHIMSCERWKYEPSVFSFTDCKLWQKRSCEICSKSRRKWAFAIFYFFKKKSIILPSSQTKREMSLFWNSIF